MKFRRNVDNKIVLKTSDGKKAYFSHAVDAMEALNLLDENGEARYTLPPESVVSIKEMAKQRAAQSNKGKKIYRQTSGRGKKILNSAGKVIPPEHLADDKPAESSPRVFVDKDMEEEFYDRDEEDLIQVEDLSEDEDGEEELLSDESIIAEDIEPEDTEPEEPEDTESEETDSKPEPKPKSRPSRNRKPRPVGKSRARISKGE